MKNLNVFFSIFFFTILIFSSCETENCQHCSWQVEWTFSATSDMDVEAQVAGYANYAEWMQFLYGDGVGDMEDISESEYCDEALEEAEEIGDIVVPDICRWYVDCN